MIAFTVYGRPQSRGSKRTFLTKHGNIAMRDDNKKSKDWMTQIRAEAAKHAPSELLTGPIELRLCFRFARPKSHFGTGRNASVLKPSAPEYHTQTPDLTKLIRGLEDALTGVIWRDDRQIVRYGTHTEWDTMKTWTTGPEGVDIEVEEVTEW